jgi:DNA-binding CsgD family transcriptional regulator
MSKKGNAAPGGARKGQPGKERSRSVARRPVNGGRAVPGTVPRGSFHLPQGAVITPLGRTILDKLDRGILVMDSKGRVIDSNPCAERVMRACEGINLRNGRLSFTDPALDDRLVQALGKYHAGIGYGHPVIAACVRCSRSAPCRVLVVPLAPGDDGRDIAFFALIYAPNGSQEISLEVLRQLYGLTQAQAEVARSLYAGRSVEDTALVLNLSLNTIRTHLKHIFTKCEVGSQAELLHMLALGPHSL